VQQTLVAGSATKSYASSFVLAGVLLLVGAALTFLIKPPQPKAAAVPA